MTLTGYGVWFGAHNLTDYVMANLASFSGHAVLEVGAGLGLCGISVATMLQDGTAPTSGGPLPIVLTDGEVELLPLLRENCAANQVAASVSKLWWGDEGDISAIEVAHPSGFGVVLGADLIYSTPQLAALPPLFATVSRLMARGADARFYLAVTRRSFGISDVLAVARAHGFRWSVGEDTIYDIFDNNTDEQTFMWRDAVYIFRRKLDGEEDQYDEEDEDNCDLGVVAPTES